MQLCPHIYVLLPCTNMFAPCLQGRALVGSSLSLAQIPAEGCSLYPSCEVCARARGLGCEWSTKEAACKKTTAELVHYVRWLDEQELRIFPPFWKL